MRCLCRIPLDEVRSALHQPRRVFAEESIAELAESIRAHGLISPLTVRKTARGYELIAGERRVRALKSLGARYADAVVMPADDTEAGILSLIENIQRENLHYLEEAEAFRTLIDTYALSQEALAKRVGRSQSCVANLLRLLRLPASARKRLMELPLTERHARALLPMAEDAGLTDIIEKAAKEHWSVRTLEARVRPKKACRVFLRDRRVLVNTIMQAVRAIRDAGVACVSAVHETDEAIEIVITMPREHPPR